MSRGTKNIILIIIMIVMLVCSYFTVDRINNRGIRIIDDNRNTLIQNNNDNKNDDKIIEDKEVEKEETSESVTNNKDNNRRGIQRPNRDRNNNDDNNRRNNNNNNNFNFNRESFYPVRRTNNTIYIILFGLESMIFGICGLYLFLLNTNKLKEEKTSFIKKLKTK